MCALITSVVVSRLVSRRQHAGTVGDSVHWKAPFQEVSCELEPRHAVAKACCARSRRPRGEELTGRVEDS